MAYKINGKDLKEVFGIYVAKNGNTDFLSLPKRKESLKNNFPEQPGVDVDLTEPYFEARQFTLKCVLIANNRDDFKTKYAALFTELSMPGVHDLYVGDLDQTFKVYYSDQQNVSKLTRLTSSNKVTITFDLIFEETNPADNIPAVYLIDEQDRFIVA